MPLQAIAYFCSLSLALSPTLSLSTTDGFLRVQGRAWLFHSNPQPHRRKSLLEHLLITTKSQTRARERSPGIRLCSNSKGLPNSPDKPLWNSTCSGCAMGSALPRTKTLPLNRAGTHLHRGAHPRAHTDSQLHTALTEQARLFPMTRLEQSTKESMIPNVCERNWSGLDAAPGL